MRIRKLFYEWIIKPYIALGILIIGFVYFGTGYIIESLINRIKGMRNK